MRELLEEPNVEVRTQLLEGFSKIVLCSKPQHEKILRSLLTLALEKGPDFVRAQSLNCILALAQIDKSSATALLKTSSSLSDWRLRYAVCSNLEKIGSLFGSAIFTSFLTKNISDYLLDQNPDTRVSALDCIPQLCKYVEADSLAVHILPCLNHIANDTEATVKIALAKKMPLLVPKLGKRKFNEFFLPLILALLRDETMDVKSAMVGSFGPIFEVVSPTVLLDAVDPALADLSKCALWRHKRTCLDFLVAVATSGGAEAVRESLLSVLTELVRDIFESVREVVADTVIRLAGVLKEDWVMVNIMPEISA